MGKIPPGNVIQKAGMQQEVADVLSRNQLKILEQAFSAKELATKTDLCLEIQKLTNAIEKLRCDTISAIEKLRSDIKLTL